MSAFSSAASASGCFSVSFRRSWPCLGTQGPLGIVYGDYMKSIQAHQKPKSRREDFRTFAMCSQVCGLWSSRLSLFLSAGPGPYTSHVHTPEPSVPSVCRRKQKPYWKRPLDSTPPKPRTSEHSLYDPLNYRTQWKAPNQKAQCSLLLPQLDIPS